MITVPPEFLEVISRWIVLGSPLSITSTVADALSSFGPTFRAAAGPLQPIGGFRASARFTRAFTHASLLYADSVHLADLKVHHASLVPLQSNSDLSGLIAALKDAVKLPGWVGSIIKWTGLITMIVGIVAYFVSPSVTNRRRGFAMATSGIVLSLVGFAFPVFTGLIHYVLSG